MNVDYKKPGSNIFSDSSDHWLAFRKKRFAVAGDGEYAVLRGLDLSHLKLEDFIAAWLVFMDCKLDGTSFRHTDFTFNATFMGCSLKGVDFTDSSGGNDLFYECDLTGAVFDTASHWAGIDLDDKKVPSYFVNCQMDKRLRDFLTQDGNVIIEGKADLEIQQWLAEASTAPSIVHYTDVHTAQEFVAYCESILAKHPEYMEDKDQQDCAGALVVLIVNDEYHSEWQKYPQIIQILDIASDLDWLNTYSAKGDWNRIRRLVAELQGQVDDHATT